MCKGVWESREHVWDAQTCRDCRSLNSSHSDCLSMGERKHMTLISFIPCRWHPGHGLGLDLWKAVLQLCIPRCSICVAPGYKRTYTTGPTEWARVTTGSDAECCHQVSDSVILCTTFEDFWLPLCTYMRVAFGCWAFCEGSPAAIYSGCLASVL